MSPQPTPAALLGQRMNKYFRYRPDGAVHRFVAFEIKGKLVVYSTDQAVFTTVDSDFFGAMADWTELTELEVAALPVATTEVVSSYQPKAPELPGTMADNFSKMFETLNYAIEKTKNDKEFIHQANSINKLVQSGINLGRLQVDAYKTMLGR